VDTVGEKWAVALIRLKQEMGKPIDNREWRILAYSPWGNAAGCGCGTGAGVNRKGVK
jgi:hypothetical protein